MARRLPKQVPVGDAMFDVVPIHRRRFWSDGIKVKGDMNFYRRRIRVAIGRKGNRRPWDAVRDTLLHEVAHALDGATTEIHADLSAETHAYLDDWEANHERGK